MHKSYTNASKGTSSCAFRPLAGSSWNGPMAGSSWNGPMAGSSWNGPMAESELVAV